MLDGTDGISHEQLRLEERLDSIGLALIVVKLTCKRETFLSDLFVARLLHGELPQHIVFSVVDEDARVHTADKNRVVS